MLPALAIALAGLAARTPLAQQWPRVAVLLFIWVAADSMMLSRMVKDRRPGARAMLAALAAACIAVTAAAGPVLREALVGMPAVAIAMAGVVLIHLGWSLAGAARRLVTTPKLNGEGWVAVLSEILPKPMARLIVGELWLLHLALFRWGAAPDVPPGARAFAYHKHLAPMMAVLLALQVIEIGVTHLLLAQFSPMAALILFVVSDVALLYLIGVIKSLRLRPILVTPEGIRIRAGILIDRFVPWSAVASVDGDVRGEEVRDPATMNAALLAWPNLVLRLSEPQPPRFSPVRRRPPLTAIAFRVDDPAGFLATVRKTRPLSPLSG